MNRRIYRRLISVARKRRVLRYNEIAPLAGLDMKKTADRNEIGRILGIISTFEHQHHRPLLSAVVIHSSDNIPGKGFFELAMNLNLYDGRGDFMFFHNELCKVHNYWSHH